MAIRPRSFFALVAVASLALAGCASDALVADEVSISGDAAVDDAGAVLDNSSVAALTGLDVEPGSLARPAFAVKLDNHPFARPQVGLDVADIVFEELVEGGYTRYIGVWHSNVPAEIGPVRSVRPMDADIVSPFGGVFTYFLGQRRFIDKMLEAPVYNIILGQAETKDLYYRSSDKVAPHNVLVKPNELIGQHLDLPAPKPFFSYAPSVEEATAVVEGKTLVSVNTRFSGISSPTWEWESTLGKFLRFQTNGAADSASSGNQIAAENVITLLVDIIVIEDIPTTRLINQGKGWIASGGSIIEINWIKATPESPIVLSTQSGEDVLLVKGQTWIELLPDEDSDVGAGSVTIK